MGAVLAVLGGAAIIALGVTALPVGKWRRMSSPVKQQLKACLPNDGAVQLIAETEAFLSGDILHYLRGSGGAVPGWAWVNVLSHGDLDHLRQVLLADSGQPAALQTGNVEAWTVPNPLEESWRAARAQEEAWTSAQRLLANELLELVDDDQGLLTYLQQKVLVPVELRFMDRESHGELTAFDLVQSTRSALRSIMS